MPDFDQDLGRSLGTGINRLTDAVLLGIEKDGEANARGYQFLETFSTQLLSVATAAIQMRIGQLADEREERQAEREEAQAIRDQETEREKRDARVKYAARHITAGRVPTRGQSAYISALLNVIEDPTARMPDFDYDDDDDDDDDADARDRAGRDVG